MGACRYVCAVHMPYALEGREGLDPLGLDLLVVVSCHVGCKLNPGPPEEHAVFFTAETFSPDPRCGIIAEPLADSQMLTLTLALPAPVEAEAPLISALSVVTNLDVPRSPGNGSTFTPLPAWPS